MERFFTIIKVIVSVVIISVIGVLIVVFHESGKAEKEYQSAISHMNSGDWSSALSSIQQVPFYKDSSTLYTYIFPHKLFYDKYSSDEEAIKAYKAASNFIATEKTSLGGENRDKYLNDFNDLQMVLNFKVAELSAKAEGKTMIDNYNNAVMMIKQGELQKAQEKLEQVNSSSLNEKKQELLKYINLLNAIKAQSSVPAANDNTPDKTLKDNIEIISCISELNPNYSGELADDIKKTAAAYVDIKKWNAIYKGGDLAVPVQKPAAPTPSTFSISVTGGTQVLPQVNVQPAVGMKREDIISILGNPQKDNIISNKYGNYEEMIYDNNRIIYFENNIVAVIKE